MKRKIILLILSGMCLMMIFAFSGCKSDVQEAYYPNWAFENLKKEPSQMSGDANVRIMSANVLVHIKGWGGTPVKPRAQQFAEVLNHYSPDVVALQEACKDWYKLLPPQIEQSYAMLDTKPSDYTTMIYNKNKVNLVDQGILRYSKQSNKNCRFVVWGVFERIEGGEKFAVTSTHWDFGQEPEKVEMRNTQIKELNELILKLENDYNVPVFAAGDYNCLEKDVDNGAQSYIDFLKESNTIDAKFADSVEKNFGSKVTYEEETWDHIFLKGEIKPISFNILANDFYESISDHYPIYFDAKI